MNSSIVPRPRSIRRWLVATAAVAAVLLAACEIAGEEDGSILEGVPESAYAGYRGGTVLRGAPEILAPAIGVDTAVADATRMHEGGQVRQAVFVQMLIVAADPPETLLAWAVSFEPDSVRPAPPLGCLSDRGCPTGPYEAAYAVVFISAETGELIFAADATRPLTD